MTTSADINGFRNHPLWDEIASLRRLVSEALPHDSRDRETMARIEAILSYAAGFRSSNAHLFATTWNSSLTDLNSHVSYVSSNFQDWDQSAAMPQGIVARIDSYLDGVLGILVTLPSLQKESRARVIAEAGNAYREAAEASLETLRKSVANLDADLVEARQTLSSTQDEAAQAKTEAIAAHEDLSTVLKEAEDRAHEALRDRVDKMNSEIDAERAFLRANADDLLTQLKRHETTARTLLEHVADASVAGGYQKYANREQKAFRIWNIIGLSVAAVVAIYLAVRFWNIDELTVQESILRAAISLPGLAVAAYCLRQAGLRQKESIEAKYRELDLIALPPFTDSMNEDQKSELRMLLGQRIFGTSVQQATEGKEPANPLSAISVEDLTKLIQSIRA